MRDIAQIRKEYMLESFLETDASPDPVEQFERWWDQAINSGIDEINAMTLATVNAKGAPTARMVLLKGYDRNGFVFFTNYESQKARDLEKNPLACLVFFWKELERQIRIEGVAEKISAENSDAYFSSRPRGSQLGAWASPQSRMVPDRSYLEKARTETESRFSGKTVDRPAFWGGYIVRPLQMEFWQGRPDRMHDRIVYTMENPGIWSMARLAP